MLPNLTGTSDTTPSHHPLNPSATKITQLAGDMSSFKFHASLLDITYVTSAESSRAYTNF